MRGGIPHWTKKEFGACIEWVSMLVFSTGDVGPKPTADAQPCTRTCDPGLSTVEVRGFGGGAGERQHSARGIHAAHSEFV